MTLPQSLSLVSDIKSFANYSENNANNTYFDTNTNKSFTLKDINETIVKIKKLEVKAHKTLNLYTLMIISSTVLELIKYYMVFTFAKNSSINLHRNMVNSILNSVMSFFDNYFIGNILNRFIQDLSVIDEHLPFILSILIGVGC